MSGTFLIALGASTLENRQFPRFGSAAVIALVPVVDLDFARIRVSVPQLQKRLQGHEEHGPLGAAMVYESTGYFQPERPSRVVNAS